MVLINYQKYGHLNYLSTAKLLTHLKNKLKKNIYQFIFVSQVYVHFNKYLHKKTRLKKLLNW